MGRFREQATREVLPAHERRKATARRGDRGVDPGGRRHASRAGVHVTAVIARLVAAARSLWSNLARRDRVDEALDDELRAYVELLAAEYERGGMAPEMARRAALVDTGGITQVKEATRDAWLGDTLATTSRELRYALRSLRRSPTFLVVAVVTLAIGIGGATAVFTVINASLLRPLPAVEAPDRLVSVERVLPSGALDEFSYPDFVDLRERSTALAALAAYNGTPMALADTTPAGQVMVGYVSDDFFTVLGARPALGAFFGTMQAAGPTDQAEVVVLGHALWKRRFGGARTVLGSTVTLDGHPFTVIGVAPPGFVGAMARYPMEMWIPVASGGRPSPTLHGLNLTSRRTGWVRLIGRLVPGKTVADAQTDLTTTSPWLASTHATNKRLSVVVFPGSGMSVEDRAQVSRLPRLLAMAVGLLLLIACAHAASLTLIRSATRRRELATRLALGASRAVLVRQVVVEGAIVAIASGVLG